MWRVKSVSRCKIVFMRIAIVKLSALGDIVQAMVILQFIKKCDKEISIDWIVEESYEELFKSHPHINALHLVNLRNAKKKKSIIIFIKELIKIRNLDSYDLVIDIQGLIKSALIAKLIPSKVTLGFDKFSTRERLASFFYNKTFKYGYDENIIERNVAIIEFALSLNISKKQIEKKLAYLIPSEQYSNFALSKIKKNIILVLGASFLSKRYPVEQFAELTNLLDANYLIIWGTEDEKYLANSLKKLAPNVSICDKLSLGGLISLVAKVDLIIGPDTGPTHMGWALNIPSITLFGPTPGNRNSYLTKINHIIESKSEVNPRKINKNDNSIREIRPIEIIKLSEEILNK